MEQLIWAIIFIIFIIATVLRTRARKRPETAIEETTDTRKKTKERREGLNKYLEELFGMEIPETKPKIIIKEEKPKPLKTRVTQKTKPKTEIRDRKFVSPLSERFREKEKSITPERKEIYQSKFPWGFLIKKDLPSAIIFSEIIGPPISKRKSHRLF